MNITDEILEEFKERMHLGDEEDENLRRILSASVEDLKVKCGDYDINTNKRFKELVFERSRYAYNDALEYFDINFQKQINSLGFDYAFSKEGGENETE